MQVGDPATLDACRLAPEFELGHRPALDGVRGTAVVLVMAFHTPLYHFLPGANLFLDVFFVLSGFLITVLLAQEQRRTGRIHLGHFYLRRGLRLLPALAVVLGFCWLLARLRVWPWEPKLVYQAVLLTACYAANWYWYFGVLLLPLGHTWTLGLEEQFYLVWPLVLMGLLYLRVPRRWILLTVVGMILASALLRARLWQTLPGPLPYHVCATCLATRADGFLAGCLAGLLAAWGYLPRRPRSRALLQGAAWVAAAALLALVFLLPDESTCGALFRGGFTVIDVGAALVLAALVNAPAGAMTRVLGFSWLTWVGTVSYGLYLWHFPIFCLPFPAAGTARGGQVFCWVLKIGLAFGAAAFSYSWIELPFLRLKGRFAKAHVGQQGLKSREGHSAATSGAAAEPPAPAAA